MERDKLKTDISKRPTGVFYVDGNKTFYFEQSLSSPIALDIPPDTISNLELINKKKLDTLIQSFIRSYNLVPKNIAILLSTRVTFDKDFPNGSIEIEKNIDEFLELVPFEEIINKRIMLSGKTRVVAINREISDSIKSSFVAAGFLVSGVYPLSLVVESVPELQSNLDLNLAVTKVPDLKAYNLVPTVEASLSSPEKEKPNKTRIYAEAGVFVFLILILIFVVFVNVLAPKKPVNNTLPKPVESPPVTIAPVSPVDQTTINSSTPSGVNNAPVQ